MRVFPSLCFQPTFLGAKFRAACCSSTCQKKGAVGWQTRGLDETVACIIVQEMYWAIDLRSCYVCSHSRRTRVYISKTRHLHL